MSASSASPSTAMRIGRFSSTKPGAVATGDHVCCARMRDAHPRGELAGRHDRRHRDEQHRIRTRAARARHRARSAPRSAIATSSERCARAATCLAASSRATSSIFGTIRPATVRARRSRCWDLVQRTARTLARSRARGACMRRKFCLNVRTDRRDVLERRRPCAKRSRRRASELGDSRTDRRARLGYRALHSRHGRGRRSRAGRAVAAVIAGRSSRRSRASLNVRPRLSEV